MKEFFVFALNKVPFLGPNQLIFVHFNFLL